MWFWLISSISGSILGSATSKWFEKTQLGRWTYDKIYNLYNWAADRYGLQIIKAEESGKVSIQILQLRLMNLKRN